SSIFEMAARGGVGLRLDLDQVPLREPGLSAYEMMLSESQERMVIVAPRFRVPAVGGVPFPRHPASGWRCIREGTRDRVSAPRDPRSPGQGDPRRARAPRLRRSP
ncbi:MAG: hypothetical protein K8I65_08615, partial [Thermoanaerobaculia bacterium]|nr:hypothetical protein [Thermoanaerobaculia bacterium]